MEDGNRTDDTFIASHTSSLIRAVEWISLGINNTLSRFCNGNATKDCLQLFLQRLPNRNVYDGIVNSSQNGEEISKTYGVLVIDSGNAVEVKLYRSFS